MGKPKLNIFESFVYVMTCIFTMGAAYILKIIIKKAMLESK